MAQQQPVMAYLSLILYALYLIGWNIFQRFKVVRRLVNGTFELPLKQARLHRIIFRRKRDPEEISRREDFLTVDDGFISKEALKGAEWTIYSIDKVGYLIIPSFIIITFQIM